MVRGLSSSPSSCCRHAGSLPLLFRDHAYGDEEEGRSEEAQHGGASKARAKKGKLNIVTMFMLMLLKRRITGWQLRHQRRETSSANRNEREREGDKGGLPPQGASFPTFFLVRLVLLLAVDCFLVRFIGSPPWQAPEPSRRSERPAVPRRPRLCFLMRCWRRWLPRGPRSPRRSSGAQ